MTREESAAHAFRAAGFEAFACGQGQALLHADDAASIAITAVRTDSADLVSVSFTYELRGGQ